MQSSRKRCVPKIPGHALEKNTRKLYRFFFFLFREKIRPHVRPYGRLYDRLCRTRGVCVQRLCGPHKNDAHAVVAVTVFLRLLVKDPFM